MRERCEAAGVGVAGDSPLWADALASGAALVLVVGVESIPSGSDRERALPPLVLASDEESALRRAAGSGARAWGVVALTVTPQELAAAVEAVRRGLAVAPPGLVAATLPSSGRSERAVDAGERLTPREQHVLELMAEGRSNRSIADALGISEHTVKFHLASIYGKLGASTRTEAVRRGLRRGLISI